MVISSLKRSENRLLRGCFSVLWTYWAMLFICKAEERILKKMPKLEVKYCFKFVCKSESSYFFFPEFNHSFSQSCCDKSYMAMTTEGLRLKYRQTLIPVHIYAVGLLSVLEITITLASCSSDMLLLATFCPSWWQTGSDTCGILNSWPNVALPTCWQWKSVYFFHWHASPQGSVELWVCGALSLLPGW